MFEAIASEAPTRSYQVLTGNWVSGAWGYWLALLHFASATRGWPLEGMNSLGDRVAGNTAPLIRAVAPVAAIEGLETRELIVGIPIPRRAVTSIFAPTAAV